MFLTFPWTWIKWMVQRIGCVRVSPWKTNGFEGTSISRTPHLTHISMKHYQEHGPIQSHEELPIPWKRTSPIKSPSQRTIAMKSIIKSKSPRAVPKLPPFFSSFMATQRSHHGHPGHEPRELRGHRGRGGTACHVTVAAFGMAGAWGTNPGPGGLAWPKLLIYIYSN